MTPDEHLDRIDAKCAALLAMRHTPAPWRAEGYDVKQPSGRCIAYFGPHHTPPDQYPASCRMEDERNATFAAACAGRAEAGWHATRAAIEFYREMQRQGFVAKFMADAVIAAWPEDML